MAAKSGTNRIFAQQVHFTMGMLGLACVLSVLAAAGLIFSLVR
jgi:hypothetical protein